MKQETYDKWKSIIDSYDPSKETVKDYCLNNHINPKSYMRNKMLQKRHPDDQKYPAILRKLVSEAKMWRKRLKQNSELYPDYLKWIKQFDRENE